MSLAITGPMIAANDNLLVFVLMISVAVACASGPPQILKAQEQETPEPPEIPTAKQAAPNPDPWRHRRSSDLESPVVTTSQGTNRSKGAYISTRYSPGRLREAWQTTTRS